MLKQAQFTKINDGFLCEHCGKEVPPAKATCRNHCPFCLRSKHVDVMPGDRASACHGLMDPVSYEISGKKGIVLVFSCRRCGYTGRNKAATSGFAPDSLATILGVGV